MKDILYVYFDEIKPNNMSGLDVSSFDELDFVWQYELENVDFSKYKGIIITAAVDQIMLKNINSKILEFIKNGGRVLFNGHVENEFFDFLTCYSPVKDIKHKDFFITLKNSHRIYKDLDIADFNEKNGVAGFYSRGENPPPKGAKIITAIKDGLVSSDWEIDINKGKFYAHAGVDLHIASKDGVKTLKNIIAYLRGEDE